MRRAGPVCLAGSARIYTGLKLPILTLAVGAHDVAAIAASGFALHELEARIARTGPAYARAPARLRAHRPGLRARISRTPRLARTLQGVFSATGCSAFVTHGSKRTNLVANRLYTRSELLQLGVDAGAIVAIDVLAVERVRGDSLMSEVPRWELLLQRHRETVNSLHAALLRPG
jgi:hypothetical protein